MTLLIVGLIVFFAVHALPMQTDVRNGLMARFGEGPYKIAFSVVSLIGFVLIVLGYGKLQVMAGKNPQIWVPPTALRHVAMPLMMVSMVLLVAAYIPSNIKRIVGHPMLAAVKIWAFAHLLVNGDLASLLLFGAFLAYAVVDRISLKRRGATVSAGGGIGGDIAAVVIGLALYAALVLFAHEWLFRVAPVPGVGL